MHINSFSTLLEITFCNALKKQNKNIGYNIYRYIHNNIEEKVEHNINSMELREVQNIMHMTISIPPKIKS